MREALNTTTTGTYTDGGIEGVTLRVSIRSWRGDIFGGNIQLRS